MDVSLVRELAEIFSKFGPYAVFAVLILFLGFLIRTRKWEKLEKWTKAGISFVFVIILVFTLFVWFKTNFPREYVIDGKFENIMSYEKILSDDIYLKRNYVGSTRYYDYDWKFISTKKFNKGAEIRFVLDKSQIPEEEDVSDFRITFRGDCRNKGIKIVYDRKRDKMMCINEPEMVNIEKTVVQHMKNFEVPSISRSPFLGIVFAAEKSQIEDEPKILTPREKELILLNLQVEDVLIRRRARDKLTFHGPRNIDFLNELLRSESFWLKLGVLKAIKYMNPDKIQEIKPALDIEQIVRLSEEENETLHRVARDVLHILEIHESRS